MMAASQVQPGSMRAWLLAARPATLTAAFVPVAVGSACAFAAEGFHGPAAAAALLGAFLIQIGTNFANDVFDFEKGTDDDGRLGPTRAAQAGLLSPAQLKRGMWCVFGAAVAVGLYLTWIGGWPIVAIGVASIAAGIMYTAGPWPLAYHGLGDVFVMLFFGFVAVCGTAYVQTGTVPVLALWCSVPIGSLATGILVVNNLRDAPGDAVSNKRTLVVRFGKRAGLVEYWALLAIAYLVPVVLWSLELTSSWVLLTWLSAPLAARLAGDVARRSGKDLNPTLAATAKLLLIFGVLLSIGLSCT